MLVAGTHSPRLYPTFRWSSLKRQYEAYGSCIYCGASGLPLSREHIIPYSLGGQLVLPAASCNECADITKRIEQKVAQDTYGIHRAHTLAPSRRKKAKHKKTLDSKVTVGGVDFNGAQVKADVSVKELPLMPMRVFMEPPKLLLTDAPSSEGQEFTLHCAPKENDPQFSALREKLKWSKISVSSPKVDPVNFMRFLAKIAHTYTCAEFPDWPYRPTLPDIVLGKSGAIGHFIGGFDPQVAQASCTLSHSVREAYGSRYLVVEISLHYLKLLPRYQVISGIMD